MALSIKFLQRERSHVVFIRLRALLMDNNIGAIGSNGKGTEHQIMGGVLGGFP